SLVPRLASNYQRSAFSSTSALA
ncbi:eamA-like transporter family protein, partial [Vibrio parahaemolyticus AQ3810]